MAIAIHTDVYEITSTTTTTKQTQIQTNHPDNSTNLLVYLPCIYNIYMIEKITKHFMHMWYLTLANSNMSSTYSAIFQHRPYDKMW